MSPTWKSLLQPGQLWTMLKETFTAWSDDKVPSYGALSPPIDGGRPLSYVIRVLFLSTDLARCSIPLNRIPFE